MRCPNCKCIVPGNVSVCSYCGYEIMNDTVDTMGVNGMNYDGFYDKNFINYANNSNGYFNTPWEIYGNIATNESKRRKRKRKRKRDRITIDGDVMFISIMVGLTCLGIILSLLLLVV